MLFKRSENRASVIVSDAPATKPATTGNQTNQHLQRLASLMAGLRSINMTLVEAFKHIDIDQDKALTFREFMEGMQKIKIAMSQTELLAVFKQIDANQDSKITIDEVSKAVKTLVHSKTEQIVPPVMSGPAAGGQTQVPPGMPNKIRADRRKQENKLVESTVLKDSLRASIIDKKTSLESASSKINDLIANIVIKPEDYFGSWKTIFNDPIKCLKYCIDTESKLNSESTAGNKSLSKYEDPEFGPQPTDSHGYSSVCFDPPYAEAPPADYLFWKRPEEIYPAPVVCEFLKQGATSNDVTQGNLGDCWIIGALNIVSQHDHLLIGSFKPNPDDIDSIPTDEEAAGMLNGIYPQIYHRFAKIGLYVFRFYKNFAWRYVVIDDTLPCLTFDGDSELIFATSSTPGELWVPLVEKAYAKIHGAYQGLISGDLSDGLVDFTGLVSEKIMLNVKQQFNSKLLGSPDALWNRILQLQQDQALMGCSIVGIGIEKEVIDQGIEVGLIAGHAYSIQSALTIKDAESGKDVRLVRIRNPWGSKKPKEWGGRWSDNSAEMMYNWKIINETIKVMDKEEAELIHIDSQNDGNFFMCFEDFLKFFSKLSVCIKFPKIYDGVRFAAEWSGSNAGGLPYKERPSQIESWQKNVQYYISVPKETHMFFSLGQEDGRLKASGSEIFPFASSIFSAILLLFKTTDGCKKIGFSRSNLIAETTLKQFRESSLSVKLPAGEYVAVPSTKEPGQEGKYYLSIYHNGGPETIIKCIDTNKTPDIIAEESEVFEALDPNLKLCLKHQIISAVTD